MPTIIELVTSIAVAELGRHVTPEAVARFVARTLVALGLADAPPGEGEEVRMAPDWDPRLAELRRQLAHEVARFGQPPALSHADRERETVPDFRPFAGEREELMPVSEAFPPSSDERTLVTGHDPEGVFSAAKLVFDRFAEDALTIARMHPPTTPPPPPPDGEDDGTERSA